MKAKTRKGGAKPATLAPAEVIEGFRGIERRTGSRIIVVDPKTWLPVYGTETLVKVLDAVARVAGVGGAESETGRTDPTAPGMPAVAAP